MKKLIYALLLLVIINMPAYAGGPFLDLGLGYSLYSRDSYPVQGGAERYLSTDHPTVILRAGVTSPDVIENAKVTGEVRGYWQHMSSFFEDDQGLDMIIIDVHFEYDIW